MSAEKTFEPRYTVGQTVIPDVTSQSIAIGYASETICLSNFGTEVAFVRVGLPGITATTADYPVMPASQVTISKGLDDSTVAFISPSGPGSLHIIPGVGY